MSYSLAFLWSLLAYFVSALNDVSMKDLGGSLSSMYIIFLRFFLGSLMLLPFLKRTQLRSPHMLNHIFRGILLFLAMLPWCYGVVHVPVTLATTMSFSTPFFVIPLAKFFLGNRITWVQIIAIMMGFLGVYIALRPSVDHVGYAALALLGSTLIFAILDILNKKLVNQKEPFWNIIFFSSSISACIAGVVMLFVTPQDIIMPSMSHLVSITRLAIGSNLVLFFLLKAFSYKNLIALQPIRYTELLFSAILGWWICNNPVPDYVLWGSALIIPASLMVLVAEHKR